MNLPALMWGHVRPLVYSRFSFTFSSPSSLIFFFFFCLEGNIERHLKPGSKPKRYLQEPPHAAGPSSRTLSDAVGEECSPLAGRPQDSNKPCSPHQTLQPSRPKLSWPTTSSFSASSLHSSFHPVQTNRKHVSTNQSTGMAKTITCVLIGIV